MAHGVLDGTASVPEHWTLSAKGDLFGHPPKVEVGLDAPDLGAFLALTPFALPAGAGGSVALHGNMTLPQKAGELPDGAFTLTRVRVDFPAHPGILTTKGEVRATLSAGRLTIQEFEAAGEGATSLKIAGWLALSQTPMTFSASATARSTRSS